jgi:hypothetical protein
MATLRQVILSALTPRDGEQVQCVAGWRNGTPSETEAKEGREQTTRILPSKMSYGSYGGQQGSYQGGYGVPPPQQYGRAAG